MANTTRINGAVRDGRVAHSRLGTNFYRSEKKTARKLTRRVARQQTRRIIEEGDFAALPGTDREAGCCTSGWNTH
jgi:hypothetical protein